MKNVGGTRDCFGCGMCAAVCPKKVIDIVTDDNGFLAPVATREEDCVECGLCLEVCPWRADEPVGAACGDSCETSEGISVPQAFGAWSLDASRRKKCSSGGVAYELGLQTLASGGSVCGVRYNASKCRAEHYIASSATELEASAGSKYLQSLAADAFRKILENIDNKSHTQYLITGTPCQIDAFRRYIRRRKAENNFVLMDFFCHGVPSYNLWKKYCAESGIFSGTSVSWRDKASGWHDSYAVGKSFAGTSSSKRSSKLSDGDLFYRIFLGDWCLGRACYEKCPFKGASSSADIRIGDAWGKRYQSVDEGVNSVIAFSAKGMALLKESGVTLEKISFEDALDGQMTSRPALPKDYDLAMSMLRDPKIKLSKILHKLRWRRKWRKRLRK